MDFKHAIRAKNRAIHKQMFNASLISVLSLSAALAVLGGLTFFHVLYYIKVPQET